LLDCEGILDNDYRLTLLSFLLSSILIYNTLSIDDQSLDNLSMMAGFLKEEAPSLFWIIRDFSLQLLDPDGK
jgi:hypothetical protein